MRSPLGRGAGLLPLLLAPLACETGGLYHRLASDYAPYRGIGSEWVYQVADASGDTSLVTWTVVASALLEGREARLIEDSGGGFSVARAEEGLFDRTRVAVAFSSREVVLENRWRLKLQFPLAVKARWEDAFQNAVVVEGLTFSIDERRSAIVEAVEEEATPAGLFGDAYRILFTEDQELVDPQEGTRSTLLEYREWYAPDVGLVRRVEEGGATWTLIDFVIVE